MEYASLCFLSFNRAESLCEAIASARDNAHYPCEIIIHDDGSSVGTQDVLSDLLERGRISKLILNPPGHNEGVGAAINRSFAVATGDPVCKLDQDLTFEPGWLRKCVGWLDADPDIAMFGLFRYNYDPVDWRKMNHRPPAADIICGGYEYVDDFVGSAMVIPREVLEMYGDFEEHSEAFAEDVMYKQMLQREGLELALPVRDLATNHGFGIGPSTVVVAPGQVQTIKRGPVLFNA